MERLRNIQFEECLLSKEDVHKSNNASKSALYNIAPQAVLQAPRTSEKEAVGNFGYDDDENWDDLKESVPTTKAKDNEDLDWQEKKTETVAFLNLIVLLPNSNIKCCCCNEILAKKYNQNELHSIIIEHANNFLHQKRLEPFKHVKITWTDENYHESFYAGIALSMSSLHKLYDVTNRGYQSLCYTCCSVIENSKVGVLSHLSSKKHKKLQKLLQDKQGFCGICRISVADKKSHQTSKFHTMVIEELQLFGYVNLESYDIDEVEIVEQPLSVPTDFESVDHYKEIFLSLLKEEKKVQKSIVRSQLITDVKITWDGQAGQQFQPLGYLDLPPFDEKAFQCKLGDEIVVSRTIIPLWTMTCRLIKESDNEEQKACIKLKNGIGFRSDIPFPYALHLKWTDTPFWRMSQAVKKISHLKNQSIRDALLQNVDLEESSFINNTNEFNFKPLPKPIFKINEIQKAAVEMACKEPISIIQGPPGTGKSSVCISILYNLIQLKPDTKILVCAPSNQAVDELAERLDEQDIDIVRVYPERYNYNNKIVKKFSLLHKALSKDKYLESNYYDYESNKMDDVEFSKYKSALYEMMSIILRDANIVLSTCIGSGSEDFKDMCFDVVLIDESAQATEPEAIVSIELHNPSKVILVGDHCQIGPTVYSETCKSCGLETSLFERLVKKKNIPKKMLIYQYRMHPDISGLASHLFYEDKLKDGINCTERAISDFNTYNGQALVFINIPGREKRMFKSFYNENEALYIIDLLSNIIKMKVRQPEEIGVITCYQGQNIAITKLISTQDTKLRNVKVANVDAFQGQERDIVIFSAVRANRNGKVGFMSDWKRVNVALTRAKFKCIIIGDIATLQNDSTWSSVIQYCHHKNCVFQN